VFFIFVVLAMTSFLIGLIQRTANFHNLPNPIDRRIS
jgi:hypothetical protein